MSVTSQVESLLQEALTISDVHPSKDARAFAGHVAAYFSKCLSDDQPITAEWLKEQGWVQDAIGTYNPEHQDIEWRANCSKLIIEAESRTIGLNGVRTRKDLLTLIRLIEGGEQ